jgi:hypothetical protein
LRRQTTTSRVAPAGSSRDERLDPFGLPLHIEPADRAGDERVRLVELHRERVVLRRVSRGIKLALNLPVAAYLGVAIRMEPPAGTAAGFWHSCWSIPIPPCRSPFTVPSTAPTLSPNGGRGVVRSAFRSWSRTPTGACASHSIGSAVCASDRRPRDDDDTRRCGDAARCCRCDDGWARCPQHRSCTAAAAISSRAIELPHIPQAEPHRYRLGARPRLRILGQPVGKMNPGGNFLLMCV